MRALKTGFFLLLAMVVLFAGSARAFIYVAPENAAEKAAQEQLLEKQVKEYQVFRFEQEHKKKENAVTEKPLLKKLPPAQKELIEKLTSPSGPGLLEQFLNMLAIFIVILALGLFLWGMYQKRPKQRARKGATAVLLAFVLSIVLLALAGALAFILTSETREVGYRGQEKQALYLAQAGIEKAMTNIQATIEASYAASFSVSATLDMLDDLVGQTLFSREAFGTGSYSVTVTTSEAVSGSYQRHIYLRATGYVGGTEKGIVAVVAFGFSASKVFDYCYFINNFGWLYGGAQQFQGDVRANGNFEVRGAQKINGDVYASGSINESQGSFFYDSLSRYYSTSSTRARPGDPPAPGEDAYPGGYDGFADNYDTYGDVRDTAAPQLHPNEDIIEMPYLGDLSYYKNLANSEGGKIVMGGTTVVNGVYEGTKVLVGTTAQPIEIDGPVVITGDVIIKGVVKGQGSIYAGRNVHIIDNLTYANPPSWPKPDYDAETTSSNNVEKDFLSLCAKGNVVMGNYTHSSWKQIYNYIKPPFTSAYVVDATDSDIGYVSYYSGGEPYFDGDYTDYDGGSKSDGSNRKYFESSLSDMTFQSYSPTNKISQVDALVYTNHLISGKVINMTFNGGVMGRDEGIVFSGYILMNYDYRVRDIGKEYVDINLPLAIMDPAYVNWSED